MVRGLRFGHARQPPIIHGLTVSIDELPTVIIGPNGAGKSTVLKLIVGLLRQQSGEVELKVPLGYSPQMPVLLPWMTVSEQVEYAGWLGKLGRSEASVEAKRVLELTELVDLAGRAPSSLSGGEAAKLGIACALVARPGLLVLDEPTAALDPVARMHVNRVLQQVSNQGVGVLCTSHAASDVAPPYRRLLLLDHGEVIVDDTPQSFLETEHQHPVAKEFAQAIRRDWES